ncbi:MAG: hypothetical protein KBD78_13705 [Oligoflexales bacterium]|nr:hypothetical protein [Oligoflexales bacterium]
MDKNKLDSSILIQDYCSKALQFEMGLGLERNLPKALEQWSLAAKLGDTFAKQNYFKLLESYNELNKVPEASLLKAKDKPVSDLKQLLKNKAKLFSNNRELIKKNATILFLCKKYELLKSAQDLAAEKQKEIHNVTSLEEAFDALGSHTFNCFLIHYQTNDAQFIELINKVFQNSKSKNMNIQIVAEVIEEKDIKNFVKIGVKGILIYPYNKKRFLDALEVGPSIKAAI